MHNVGGPHTRAFVLLRDGGRLGSVMLWLSFQILSVVMSWSRARVYRTHGQITPTLDSTSFRLGSRVGGCIDAPLIDPVWCPCVCVIAWKGGAGRSSGNQGALGSLSNRF